MVTEYFKDKLLILLKSTIYSHTNQNTGEISELGGIRAQGSNLFLEMMRRNNLKHAYYVVNKDGIILSERVPTNEVEIVFKKEFIGTDKHSYFNLDRLGQLVNKDKLANKYSCGIYVRFDWRNPNHVLKDHPNYLISSQRYYYLVEKFVGKSQFFETFLKHPQVKPMGDKCISEDLIKDYIQTDKIKAAILKLYCAFSYYSEKVGLEILDGCFMLSSDGEVTWSEINPDCMRVKAIENHDLSKREDYDKDIWRAGGSSSKDLIIVKWRLFNQLFADYFLGKRFHESELL